MISDGDSNIGYDPKDLIPYLQKEHIVIYSLAIGLSDYVLGYDYSDTPVKTTFDTSLLQLLSQVTGGRFYRILDTKTFSFPVQDIISQLKQKTSVLVQKHYWSLNRVLYPVLIFLLL
ncbi:MAG: hypothetical protein GXP45_07805 [bacterium]|nr:hypothetical protein [bacterium]